MDGEVGPRTGAGGRVALVHCAGTRRVAFSVICLVQSPPREAVVVFGYIEGPFLVRKTGCARERHTPCIEGPFLVNRTGHACERHAT
jgi:hypothetical protein